MRLIIVIPRTLCGGRVYASADGDPFNVFLIYPTPPLGQDMTQGQFLSGV